MLNSLAREKSNTQMIHTINQENPQIREMHSENIRLRASLEDHQRALEHIMSKYREHTQTAVMNTKLNFQELFRDETEKNVVSRHLYLHAYCDQFIFSHLKKMFVLSFLSCLLR